MHWTCWLLSLCSHWTLLQEWSSLSSFPTLPGFSLFFCAYWNLTHPKIYFGHLMRRVDSLEKTDAGRDWGQEEKGTTEDEMAGWHHWLYGHEFGWTPGVGDGQGGLVCCNSWGRKESDTTEQQNWTELNWRLDKTLHMDITRWSTPKSDWLYSLQPKMEKFYTVNKNKTKNCLWLRSWTPYCQIQKIAWCCSNNWTKNYQMIQKFYF